MKVLFAVNDENISTSIVKKYQKNYKEIISYKNVYYFNAILKELQRNKTYDRIVISEDLEEFTSSSYAQKDKFIFDRLDNISDEAVTTTGSDIPIILICSERRKKSEEILVKLFGIGVYNAIIGDDRSTDEVCRLINKPRSKKEAKTYYYIDSENVNYEKENESDVSEMEMQNILMHFKKLGSNTERYKDSFENIVSQYNDAQMKVIIAILPNEVKDVLEDTSTEYQRIMGVSKKSISSSDTIKKRSSTKNNSSIKKGTVEKLLDIEENKMRLTRPVVVPTTMEKSIYKKVTDKKDIGLDLDELEDIQMEKVLDNEEQPKRRGRPRKKKNEEESIVDTEQPKRRGRPKKVKLEEKINLEEMVGTSILPGFEGEYSNTAQEIHEKIENVTSTLPGLEEDYQEENNNNEIEINEKQYNYTTAHRTTNEIYDNVFDDEEFENLLSTDRKIVAFVGTSKNGTSFIVNNVAQILSNMGIDTAIFDATQNKNAYYIYTKNDEDLRKTAVQCLENLKNERAYGIKANNNLTIYTNIPNQNEEMNNSRPIIQTLVKNHTLVLMDCDFNTPLEYFEKAQEIYLVQSMDVLTIQPLTAFLRELKVKGILDDKKIRIILNKLLKIRGVSAKNIIGGMSNYNDPEMSFMTELFDRNLVKVAAQIPFDEDVYVKYLENLIQCEMKINGYPKEFRQRLNGLANVIFPIEINKGSGKRTNKNEKEQYLRSFSPGMNSTLDSMRKKY